MIVESRRAREFVRREQEILAAALRLFDGDDWEGVTVEQIANQSEIGKGTIYKHFSSKDQIYARLALDFYYGMLDELKSVESAEDICVQLRSIIAMAFQYHLDRPEYRRVTQYCHRDDFRKRSGHSITEEFNRLDSRFEEFIGEVLLKGIEQGLIPDRPVDSMILGLHATFEGAIHLLWNGCLGDDVDDAKAIQIITNYMLAGLSYLDRFDDREQTPSMHAGT